MNTDPAKLEHCPSCEQWVGQWTSATINRKGQLRLSQGFSGTIHRCPRPVER